MTDGCAPKVIRMTQQIKNAGFLSSDAAVEDDFRSRLDGALAAIKAIETAIKVAASFALETRPSPPDDPERYLIAGGRRSLPQFQLRYVAEREISIKKMRASYFPSTVLEDAGWNIMIDLFVQQQLGRDVSITSACLASGVPPTTALRWIEVLENEGVVVREDDESDRRRRFVRLTEQASASMVDYLSMVAVTRYRAQNADYP